MASDLEEQLWLQITASGLNWPQREFRFASPRRWRFDLAWAHLKLAVEVQGARWSKSTHGGGAQQTKSFEKLNTAALKSWRVLQVNAEMIENGTALALIERALRDEENPDE